METTPLLLYQSKAEEEGCPFLLSNLGLPRSWAKNEPLDCSPFVGPFTILRKSNVWGLIIDLLKQGEYISTLTMSGQ